MFQVEVFWVVMLYNVAVGYHHFRDPASSIFQVKIEATWTSKTLI
jgi:hypothetical protein